MIILGMDMKLLRERNIADLSNAIDRACPVWDKAKQILDSARRMVDLAEEAIREETGQNDAHNLEDSSKFASGLRALNMGMVEEGLKLQTHGEVELSKSLLGDERTVSMIEYGFTTKVKKDFIWPLKKFLKKYHEFEEQVNGLQILFPRIENSILNDPEEDRSMNWKEFLLWELDSIIGTGNEVIDSTEEISNCAASFYDAQKEYYRNLKSHNDNLSEDESGDT